MCSSILLLLSFNLLTLIQSQSTSAEYFSATVELNKALDAGRSLATDLNRYLNIEQSRLNKIRQIADRLSLDKASAPGPNEEPEDYFSNPIKAYKMVKHLAVDWKSELERLTNSQLASVEMEEEQEQDETSASKMSTGPSNLSDVLNNLEVHANQLPGHNDVDGAADALLRLQEVYKLHAFDMANGRLTPDIDSPKLTAAQSMHIGQQAYNRKEYHQAEEWFRVAYDRLWSEQVDVHGRETDEPQPTTVTVLDHLAYALGRQGRYAEALNITRMMIGMEPTNDHILDNIEFYEERLKAGEGIIGPAPKPEALSKYDQETAYYEAVCRGDPVFAPPKTNQLKCRLHVPHPYYILGPIREEELFPDPRIVMWYDMILPSEIKRIQELATPRLRRATVKNPITGQLEFAFYRTSKSAWLPSNLDEITNRIHKRLHRVTGLNSETSEDLQVGNYGIGGHYAPHFDFGRKREKDAFEIENGNRIATIIFYLTEVQAGGATAFNRIGARVMPVKGAAAFWYNLHPNGEGDLRTRHAACPVLVGSKWVMNVWFHERGQEFRRPCGLEPDPVEIDDGF